MKIFKINGVAQNYAWGGSQFISQLTGQNQNELIAEYWMGAHPKASATVQKTSKTLLRMIEEFPDKVLGREVFERFGKLPYLFKVLDVRDMLSIQVHPTKAEAEKGFRIENEASIPLDAFNRNYKDDNHKPEIMVALSDFWLLHGFKSEDLLLRTLHNVPELGHLIKIFQNGSYQNLFEYVMREEQEAVNLNLRDLIDRISKSRTMYSKNDAEYWALKAYDSFCTEDKMDKGIYSIFFFNIVQMKKGEAIFQDAGIPHAYLEGQNVELMANSDNVLRAGLTSKHVDVEELLKHTHFKAVTPAVLTGEKPSHKYERVYKTKAPDFEISTIQLKHEEEYTAAAYSLEIMIVFHGKVKVIGQHEEVVAERGEVIAVFAGADYSIVGEERNSILYKAAVPQQ
jgi:mannose-6-phosphate isomerase